MTLLATLSNEAIIAIAGAVYAVVEYLKLRRSEKKLEDASAKVAAKVEDVKMQTAVSANEVKTALATSNADKKAHLERQDATLATIVDTVAEVAGTVAEVKENTNGMVEKLEKASFKAGVKSEKDKNE